MSATMVAGGPEGDRGPSSLRMCGSPAEVVAKAKLPAELGNLVLEVTGKCRLTRGERISVAAELASHFIEAMESGESPSELVRTFGDPGQTARLITRAKRRARRGPARFIRRALLATGGVLLLCFLVWGTLALRYYTAKPTIKRNFVAEHNAPLKAMKPGERSWGELRAAMIALPPLPSEVFATDPNGTGQPANANGQQAPSNPNPYPLILPGTPLYVAVEEYLRANRERLVTLRRVLAHPFAGRLWTAVGDTALAGVLQSEEVLRARQAIADQPWMAETTADGVMDDGMTDNPMVVGVLLPQLAAMRSVGNLLIADARIARDGRDAGRFVDDLVALSRLGARASEDGLLISQLVGMGIVQWQRTLLIEVLSGDCAWLSNADLASLAHAISGERILGDGDNLTYVGESEFHLDWAQRTFTDDGRGDGRVTPEFFALSKTLVMQPGKDGDSEVWPEALRGPVAAEFVGSRRAFLEAFGLAMASQEREARLPASKRRGTVEVEIATNNFASDTLGPIGREMLRMLVPAYGHAARSADRYVNIRDAAVIGLALELYRRSTGGYPSTLEELVPRYLPRIPVDRIDGKPLRYKAAGSAGSGGQMPLVYSIGADVKDNGGRVLPSATFGYVDGHCPTTADTGDWVLFPATAQPAK